jgi:uncharacterized protein YegL
MSIISEQPVIYVPQDNITNPTDNLTPEEKVINNNEFQIIMIVDRSGSMNSIRRDIIGSINSVIEDQKKISTDNGVNAKFTLVTFNTERSVVYNAVPMSEVELLTPDQYQTTGGTALYKSVINTLSENVYKTNVMVIIVTDGEDTDYSGIYTQQASSRAIKKHKSAGWKFIYLSSDPTTVIQGVNMGFQSSGLEVLSCNTNNVHANYHNLGTALRRQCSAEISRAWTTGSMHGLGDELVWNNTNNTFPEEEPINSQIGLPYVHSQYIGSIGPPALTRSRSMPFTPSLGIPTACTDQTNS